MSARISLIVCTLGRVAPLRRLLASLERQTFRDFEIIVVDQNPEGVLDPVLTEHGDLPIVHVRSAKGLSRARNVGLSYCQGEIIGFPDDDCWYGPEVVETVALFFARREDVDFISGRTLDDQGNVSLNRYPDASVLISRENVFAATNSNTIFVRRSVAVDIGGFDESLGVGADTPFQAGEESDFLLRCLAAGYTGLYNRDFVVHHDQVTDSLNRLHAYSVGFGRVARIHNLGSSVFYPRNFRTVVGACLRIARGDVMGARQRYACLVGSIRGYVAPLAASDSGRNAIR
jgi:glycosyltransferase involved in cell wall biosynthesis